MFRNNMGLEGVDLATGGHQLTIHKIPFTYAMSPTVVPKPREWEEYHGTHHSNHDPSHAPPELSGFYFLDRLSHFKPPADLVEFIHTGERPIYIG